jgi:uncharacterized membrane protein YqjE
MRHDDIEVRLHPQGDGMTARAEPGPDTPLGELFRRLTSDTTDLLRQEVELAKAEVRETGKRLGHDAAKVGVAAALAFMGALSLTAFLVIALGNALGGRYWLSSLLVGGVAAGVGYSMVKSALRDISVRGVMPTQTMATLREDAQWAKQEARVLKQELTTNPADAHASTPRL